MIVREWLNRLVATLGFRRSDRDLEEELRLHVELAVENSESTGEPGEDARRTALIRAGGMAQAMDAVRDQQRLPWLADFGRDFRYGCRMLVRDRGFAIVAVISLAIGVGVN